MVRVHQIVVFCLWKQTIDEKTSEWTQPRLPPLPLNGLSPSKCFFYNFSHLYDISAAWGFSLRTSSNVSLIFPVQLLEASFKAFLARSTPLL